MSIEIMSLVRTVTTSRKRARTSSAALKRSRIPRSISSYGYGKQRTFDIPTKVLVRLYYNTSTGFWPTNQTTGAHTGLTGYEGVCFTFFHNRIDIGFGGADNIPVAGEFVAVEERNALGEVFDLFQLHSVNAELWVNSHVGVDSASTTAPHGGSEILVGFDPNDSSPKSYKQLVQYRQSKRVLTDANYRTNFKFRPNNLEAASKTISRNYGATGTSNSGSDTRWVAMNLAILSPPTPATAHAAFLDIMFTLNYRYKYTK